MTQHNKLTVGDIVNLKSTPPTRKEKITKNWSDIHRWKPFKLLILDRIDKSSFRVAVCREKKKNTQLRIKTHSGYLYVVLSKFLIIDKDNVSLSHEHQIYGNKYNVVHWVFKSRDAFKSLQSKDFFIDLVTYDNKSQIDVIQHHKNEPPPKVNIEQGSKVLSHQSVVPTLPSETQLFRQIPVLNTNEVRCPYCKRDFSGMDSIRYQFEDNGKICTRFAYARSCKQCNLAILDATQYGEIKRQIKDGNIITLNPATFKTAAQLMEAAEKQPEHRKISNNIEPLPFEKEIHRPVNLSEHGKKITIFAQKCHCTKCFKKYDRHTILSRTAKVLSTSGQMVDVNVMFCAGCGHYYMGYESFKQYKKMYGRLLFECELSSELQNGRPSFLDFAPDSLLSRWGYNVKKDMPKEHRQAILQFLLETKRISKFEAVEMIKGFISLKERQPRFHDACERWREDILFINNYRIKGQDVVYGLTFKQGGKISR